MPGADPITLEPDGAAWATLVRDAWARSGERASRFRASIGLPTDRPVVLTGHQAELWHPGILAKWFAAEAVARSVDGAAAWLVADQDANDPLALRAPIERGDGTLASRVLHLGAAADDSPTGLSPAVEPSAIDPGAWIATPELGPRLEAAVEALRLEADAPSAAEQTQGALRGLLGDLFEPAHVVYSLRLNETALFAELVERMREDPAAMARAYNESAIETMHAGVAPLDVSGGRVELPVWRVARGEPRGRVHADELAGLRPGELAPRALLMTAMLRLAGCELFIHGTGGASYDRVTERWVARWLGEPLAPAALATADVRLDLPGADVGTTEVARARWRAHHARHAPEMADRPDLAEAKRSLVAQIDGAARGGAERRALFTALQTLLAGYRSEAAGAIDDARREAERVELLARSAGVARARDWSVALHDRAALWALRRRIAERFGAREACGV
jgi:hypothetical protein